MTLPVLQITSAKVQIHPKPLHGVRGKNLTVTCSFPEDTVDIQLSLRGNDIRRIGSKFLGLSLRGNTSVDHRYGPLEASDNGAVFKCTNRAGSMDSTTLVLLGKGRFFSTCSILRELIKFYHAVKILIILFG